MVLPEKYFYRIAQVVTAIITKKESNKINKLNILNKNSIYILYEA